MEEDDGTLPEGYVGTVDNIQYYQLPSTVPQKCNTHGQHKLLCGHWIYDTSKLGDPGLPCGTNCIEPVLKNPPFQCPTCAGKAAHIVENGLTEPESARLKHAHQKSQFNFIVAYITECVMKRGEIPAGVSEIVTSLMQPNYARKCTQAAAPEPVKFMTPAELLEGLEKSRRERALRREKEKVKGGKRSESPVTESGGKSKRPMREQARGDGVAAWCSVRPVVGLKRSSASSEGGEEVQCCVRVKRVKMPPRRGEWLDLDSDDETSGSTPRPGTGSPSARKRASGIEEFERCGKRVKTPIPRAEWLDWPDIDLS
ncbi:hypothetical protein M011DRAFT_475509 [Sporormia fimetaria CBS 119925]|uniref:Uncharacterized protein n=1 Tax=Sporormia fimetaria CBS 119925 TaxID=1340428 RepID=A0A6A6VGX6_9PLEO|nr:hypothetical protein M011DRAFT_475509 [Sporormia fimetaria CBS 119925]